MSAGASKATKALRARLAAARDALTAGDGQGARALTREALALDDTSYDAWVFDGKAAFACGDSRDALASYARAAKIRDDHPAARRGAVEAALGFQTSSPESTSEASSLVVHALRDALALPADAKQLTPARRVAWTAALAEACEAAGNHAEARERWTALAVRGGFIGHARMHDSDDSRVSEDVDVQPEARSDDGLAMPDPNLVVRALEGAARCALAEEEASSRDEEDRAAEAVRSSTIASPAEIRAARAAAAKARAATPNPVFERAVRALLDAEARASAEDPVGAAFLARGARAFDAKLDAATARRAAARLDLAAGADAAGAAALDALGEVELLLARRGAEPEALRLARDTALEAAAALDAGWDVEEEGWEETRVFDEESVTLTRRALAALRACDPESAWKLMDETDDDDDGADRLDRLASADVDPTADPAETIARVWCRFADPEGRGRSGRAAHAPGSRAAARAFPARAREALVAALRRDDAVVADAGKDAEKERTATTARATSPGASLLGWGAAAEAALAADRPGEALNAARAGLAAARAARARERPSAGGIAPRAQAAERRLRVVSAEALCALGRLAEASAAFRAIAPPSPRTTRGLAAASDARDARLALLKRAASAFGPAAPRPLAELGWAMLEAGGEGAASRARRALERACELVSRASDVDSLNGQSQEKKNVDVDVAAGAPPDFAARLGVARWRDAADGSRDAGERNARATARGPGSARAALLAAAAEEGPWRATAFAHLALVYAASGDEPRAAKCRARALALDPADPTAGPAACDVARADARETERVCERALAVSSRCSWAAVRLAPIAARRGDHEAAAAALRTTLRGGDADAPAAAAAWEALGASYDAMDKHSAALKAYRKAMDVESSDLRLGSATRVYASTRSGRLILETEGDLDAAVAAHAAALAAAPGHPAAALGLAEAETARAKDAARRGALARAAGAAARAAAAAETARAARPHAPIRAAAKRAGDAYLVAATVAVRPLPWVRPANREPCPEPIDADHCQPPRRERLGATEPRDVLCRAARRAYARGALATPHRAAAWFDLAAACVVSGDAPEPEENAYARYARSGNGFRVFSRVALASRCLRASLRLDPANPAAWVALGTLPAEEDAENDAFFSLKSDARGESGEKRGASERRRRDRARRETALARATHLDPSSAPAWAALGRVYVAAALDREEDFFGEKSETAKEQKEKETGEEEDASSLQPGSSGSLARRSFWLRRASAALDRARAADPGSQEAWTATAMLHAANADAAEAAGAARAAADAGNAAEAHRARALWGLSFAAEVLKSPEKYTATASPATAYASARRAREASPSDAAGALALGLCAEARGRDAEARAAFEDAEALAAPAGTGEASPGLVLPPGPATRAATFARTVAAEARLGAARLGESSSALGSADVRAREASDGDGSIKNTSAPTRPFLDADGLFQATARARANVHARPWCILARGELASLLSAYEASRVFSFSASRVVPEASYANTGHARASLVSAAESTTRAAVAAAAAALAATPAGAGADADADADAIGRRLARAIRAHPACASAPIARALLALVAARRAVAGEKSERFLRRAADDCETLAAAVARSDARLATSLLAAAAEARARGGDAQAAAALAAKASAAAAGADATARRLAAAQERRCAFFLRGLKKATSDVTSDEGAYFYRDACGVSVLDPESDAFATAARLASAAAALAAGDSGEAEASLREAARACAASVARGGATTGTAAAARVLLGATLGARREPKASKEAGKILAKATRGAAAGGIGVRAAAEARARVARAAGLEVKT